MDPADILIHISIPGEPHAKERPRNTKATLDEATGTVIQGHTYTPQATRQAEETLRWVFLAARRFSEPVAHPVGVLLFFKTTSSRTDSDNLLKSYADAGNGTLWVDDQQISESHVHLLRRCTHPGTEMLAWLSSRRLPGT